MDELLWIDAQKIVDLALVVATVVAVGLIVVQAAYLLMLTIVLAREKRSSKER